MARADCLLQTLIRAHLHRRSARTQAAKLASKPSRHVLPFNALWLGYARAMLLLARLDQIATWDPYPVSSASLSTVACSLIRRLLSPFVVLLDDKT